jgi:iron complex outermembrane receptor protein
MQNRFRFGAMAGVSLLTLTSAGQFAAAAEATSLETVQEVVVTVRQRSEALKDVPASVTALTAAQLASAGVQRAGDFVALTPGVSLVQAAEQGDAQVNIRGNNSARDAQASFAFVIDGIQMANPASFNREFVDLKQIEVVKGPQGAIYGRNAAAGAIIVTTQKPGDAFAGTVTASAGSQGTYTAKGLVSGPLSETVSASLGADYRKTDGFHASTLTGNQVDRYEGFNINGRIVAHLSPKTDLDIKARYGELDAGSIAYNAVFALPALATAFGSPKFYENVNTHTFLFQNNVPHVNHQDGFEISAKVDHDLGWGNLTAWVLHSDIKNNLLADGTAASFGFFNSDPGCIASSAALAAAGVTLPAPTYLTGNPASSFFGPYTPTTCDGYQFQKRTQKDTSGEIRIASPSGQRLRWLGGLYFLTIEREVGVATGIDSGGAPPKSLYVPKGQPYATEQLLDDKFDSDAQAVFGQVAYDFVPGLEGSLALRYDNEDRHVHNLVPTTGSTTYIDYNGFPYSGNATLNPGLDPTLNPAGIRDKSKSYSQLQPKIGLRWTINPEWTVYGDWGVGFKSGGFNNAGSAATINAFINPPRTAAGFTPVNISDDFKKETNNSAELGAKARLFNGRLILDAAVYDTTVKDMQFFEFFVGPFGLLRVVSNIDRVKIQGAELGAQFKVMPGLTLEASGALTDSKIKRNSVRPDTVGAKSPYTPENTWNLAVQYDRPVMTGVTFTARADVRGTGETWFHVVQGQSNPTVFEPIFGQVLGRANYSLTKRDAFTTVDLRAGIRTDKWSLIAYGQNVTDERYLSEVIPAPEFGGAFATQGPHASYGVEFSTKF